MHRRVIVAYVVGLGMCGLKRASRVLVVKRSTCYHKLEYSAQHKHSEKLVLELSERHSTLGARKVSALALHQHDVVIDHKRVARLRRKHGIRASRRGRKRRRLVGSKAIRQAESKRDEV